MGADNSVKRSTERILTTHVGSLARPHDLLELVQKQVDGEPYDEEALAGVTRRAVVDVVRKQAESGIDIVDDGEQSKSGFYAYVAQRLGGLETREGRQFDGRVTWQKEIEAFPEYYAQYLDERNNSSVRNPALVCTAPLTYTASRRCRPTSTTSMSR